MGLIGGSPYRVIPNAIEVPNYRYDPQMSRQVRQELGLGDGLVVGHVGNANPAKNHPFLLEIFAALHQKRPDARLILVGGGTERFRAKARSLGVEDAVLFAGVRKDVPRMLQAMDVFVFPSLYEGLGIVLVEAQSAGLPCVVSDTIPTDAYLTDLVFLKKLSASPEEWADAILARRNTPRTDHSAEIAALLYRTNDMILYASRKLLNRSPMGTYLKWGTNFALYGLFVMIFTKVLAEVEFTNYFTIIIGAAAVCILSVFAFFFVGSVMDRKSFLFCIEFVKAHVRKRNHA